jgi:predicted dehydrogenase
MAKREARLKEGIEAVAIVTPNHMHYPAAREFLKRGIHVICDKPLTSTLADAKKLVKAVEASDARFFLTHNYTGYPMVRQARELVERGDLGTIRVIQVEYPQDWLTVEQTTTSKPTGARTRPAPGSVAATGDIGTHAYNLACFRERPDARRAWPRTCSPSCQAVSVDDNGHVMLRFDGGARGMLWCSQVAPGNENNLKLRVYGDKAGIEWHQENPNYLQCLAVRRTGPAPDKRRRRHAGERRADNTDPPRAPGGLPGGLCQPLPRSRRRVPGSQEGQEHANTAARDQGRPCRRGICRRLCKIVNQKCSLGEARMTSDL